MSNYQDPVVTPPPSHPDDPGWLQRAAWPRADADGLAVAALVLSLLWLGGLGSILAVVFGSTHRSAARRERKQPSGLATAGVILGWAGIALAVFVVAAVIALASRSGQPVPCDPSSSNYPYC